MRTFEIVHEHEPGYGWDFHCSQLRMSGAAEACHELAVSCREAEDVVMFALEGEAEDRGEPAPRRSDVRFEHVVLSEARA